MFVVLILFILAILILSLIGYASYIAGAQTPSRWRRIFAGLTFGLVGLCCLVFTLSIVIVIPATGIFLTWPASDPLIGEWHCVEGEHDCAQPLRMEVGDGAWDLGASLTFAKGGRLTNGNRSLLLRDGVVTSGGVTCEYDRLSEQWIRLDCGYGTRDLEYKLEGDRLIFIIGPSGDFPRQTRIYQRLRP